MISQLRLRLLVLLLAPALVMCRSEQAGSSQETTAAKASVARLQDRYKLFASKIVPPKDSTGLASAFTPPELPRSDASHFEKAAKTLHPVIRDELSVPRRIDVGLPLTANGELTLEDRDADISLSATLFGAKESTAETADGWVVYRGAYQGGDVLHRPRVDGTEDYLWLEKAPPAREVRYEVKLGDGVAGLRLVENTLEFLDRHSTPRWRVSQPYLIDAAGKRIEATLAVSGCAYDKSPAAPWDRPAVAPGSRNCTVLVSWSKDVEVKYPALLDPTWTTTGAMATNRSDFAAIWMNSQQIIACGGASTSDSSSLSSCEIFNASTLSWSATQSPYSAIALTLTLLEDGRVLMAGGVTKSWDAETVQPYAATYNRVTGQWTSQTSMAYPRVGHTAARLSDGTVLVAGGHSINVAIIASSEVFDPSTNGWKTKGSMPQLHSRHAMVVTPKGPFVLGGVSSGTAPVATTAIYDESSGTWTAGRSMSMARKYLSAVPLDGGSTVLALGSGTYVAELYDVASNTWTDTGPLVGVHSEQSASALSNGNAIVIGGSPNASLKTVELFDRATNSWSMIASMNIGRSLFVSLPWGTNKVIAIGGTNSLTSNTEVLKYEPACGTCAVGQCVHGYCCDTSCNGGACQRCDLSGKEGTCTIAPAAYPNVCTPYLCDGTNASCTTSCTSDSQCASTAYCSGSQCLPKAAQGQSCSSALMCLTGFCSDGVCCSAACSGACDVCTTALGATAEGTCTNLPQGTPSTCGTGYACTGTSSACPTSCTSDTVCASGYFCSGSTCVPKKAQGVACTASNQCTSGYCSDGFCCDSACSGKCDACATTHGASANGTCTLSAAASTGNPSCAPFLCTGASDQCATSCEADTNCATNAYCNASNVCVTKGALGAVCTRAAECSSGNCADGFCCSSACSGACDFCALSKGATANGTCTNVAGSAGSPSCAPYVCSSSSASCPTTCTTDTQCDSVDYCNGSACVPKVATGVACTAAKQCLSGNCVDGYCCNSACGGSCDVCSTALGASANGSCTLLSAGVAGSPTCSPYVCNGISTSCPTNCTSDTNCASSAYCAGNVCTSKKSAGSTCIASNECSSGNCVDGYCCNTSCDGACDRCNLSGYLGTCRAATSGTLGSPSCGNYVCNGSATTCPTSCTSDSNCTSTSFCFNSQCIPKRAQGDVCTAATNCASGFCSDGVCCGAACSGTCDVCSNALGASSDGVCTVLPTGSTGACGTGYSCSGSSATCPTSCTTDASCATGYYCNGSSCAAKKTKGSTCTAANQCANGNCADGYCCDTDCSGSCDVCAASLGAVANGTCTLSSATYAGLNPSCSPFLCSGTSNQCATSCATDANCASNAFCNSANVCVLRQANGAVCTRTAECTSGLCVDGFCCNGVCGGACDTCAAALGAVANGTCTNVAGADGTPSCAPYFCSASGPSCPTTCSADSQCTSTNYCNTSNKCVAKSANGAACTAAKQCSSGNCVDGFCCDSACSGACDVCAFSLGAAANGTCTLSSSTSPGTPSCAPYLCNGIASQCPINCVNDTSCTSGSFCSSFSTCIAKQAVGASCTRGTECSSGNCVDGYCCNSACSGSCDFCSVSRGASANGTCTSVGNVPGSPSCAPYLCAAGNASCPTSCTTDLQCSTGAACLGGKCFLRQENGSTCTASSQCNSGYCVDGFCCDNSCSGSCDVCAANLGATRNGTCTPAAAGKPGSPVCDPYVCNGQQTICPSMCNYHSDCAATSYCQGGACVPRKANGLTCVTASDCASGNCVDGVCCNSSCDGPCDACNLSGRKGTCSLLSAGSDGQTSCGAYLCDGTVATCPTSCIANSQCATGSVCVDNRCQAKVQKGQACTADTLCTTGFCSDGVCCDQACSGGCNACAASLGASANGTCTLLARGNAGVSAACGAYLCGGSSGLCPTSCAGSADCAAGHFCNGFSQCVPLIANGDTCTANTQCQSGFCVDGLCCNSACTDQCAACNVSSNPGTCSPVTGAPVGTRPACASDNTLCGGQCDGATTASCAYPDTTIACGSDTCAQGVAASAAHCTGTGACLPGLATNCAPYACGPASCLEQCANNAECQTGYFCQFERCVPLLASGETCSDDTDCGSGSCADGVCCDTACAGSCDRCDLPNREGLCTLLSAGTVPKDGECAPLVCNGSSSSCPLICTSNAGCQQDHVCLGGMCLPAKGLGGACGSGEECGSGFCVDGVCCNTACKGSCATCSLPDHAGTCTILVGAAAAGRPVCTGEGACASTCDGVHSDCAFPGPETTCGPAFCDQAVQTSASTCDGAGQCIEGSQIQCGLGCAGDHCAAPVTQASGCASTEPTALAGALLLALTLFRRRTPREHAAKERQL